MSGIDQAEQNFVESRTLAPAAVGTQVLLMSVISFATVVIFNVLRPKNKVVYEPKIKYHIGAKTPPAISDSPFGWLPPLIRTKEPELLDKVGLDAAAFLRFLRLLRYLFALIAFFTCAILIPINVTYNLANVPKTSRDALSMLTIRDVSGNLLFAHVGLTYLVTFFSLFLIYRHWSAMIRLRHDWFRSPEYTESFYARTLSIRHVPPRYQSDEGLAQLFQELQIPYPTTSVHIGRRVGKLPDLIEYHNKTVREFESILVRYLKGGRIGAKRPTIRVGGKKRDAIDFYTGKLQRTEAAITTYRAEIDTRKPENYGFASMAAVPYTHVVARLLEGRRFKGTAIEPAPNPKDIIWNNITKTSGEIWHRKAIGFLLLALVCFFNTIPLIVISILASLSALTFAVPFLETWSKKSPVTFAIISGVLPPAVQVLFAWVLPIIMRRLSRYQGALTRSRLDRAVVARYYFFLIISQLVIFTLIGVLFNSVKEIAVQIGKHQSIGKILKNLDKLPSLIHRTYIDQSSFWLTFFPLRGFLVVFDLAQILNIVWIWFKTRMFGRTPRDIREWTQPPKFEYAIYYSQMLFMAAVAFVFAPLAPLVAVAAAIVFWLSSWVYKYQLMFVFVTKVESGGRLWNVVINRLLASLILMQLLMVLTIGLQFEFRSLIWLCTIPPILFVLIFKLYIKRKFNSAFRYYIPSEEEIRMAKVHSQRADNKGQRLEKRFGHPALYAELFTPMLHAKMMPLLAEVYRGSGYGSSVPTRLDEYGGKELDAQIVQGGVRIAAVQQQDLELDPALYGRDRGELDVEVRSLGSTTILDDGASIRSASKPDFYGLNRAAGSSSPVPGYDRYLVMGPGGGGEAYEMNQRTMNATNYSNVDPRPLLQHGHPNASGDFDQQHLNAAPQRQSPQGFASYPTQQQPQQHIRQMSGYTVYNAGTPPSPSRPSSQQSFTSPPQQQQQQQQSPQYQWHPGHTPSWSGGPGARP